MVTANGVLKSVIGTLLAELVLTGSVLAIDNNKSDDKLPLNSASNSQVNRSSISLAIDNDALVPASLDGNYTYGFNLTFSGAGVEEHLASSHGPLEWLDRNLGLTRHIGASIESSEIEYGLLGFTPEDISQTNPQPDDRPYAGLVYISSTRERYQPIAEISWHSTLTLGVLGLNIVGEIQEMAHSVNDNETPRGWENQISEGGELTARYSLARQSLFYNDKDLEVVSTTLGSVGYITEASWSLSLRVGNLQTPWISFNPALASYAENSKSNHSGRFSESYFWAGFALKARAYNAFLQGQFRDSEVTYDSDELNHGILEIWAGYTIALKQGYSFSYSLRGHSSELKRGSADKKVVWGSLTISRSFN